MMVDVAESEPTFWREKVAPFTLPVQGVCAPPVERQIPPMAKHPPAERLIPPPWKVEVAVVEAKILPFKERS